MAVKKRFAPRSRRILVILLAVAAVGLVAVPFIA
jgi:hypothetical protein